MHYGDGAPPEQLTSTVEYYSDDLPHPLMFSRFGLKSGRHTVNKIHDKFVDIFKDCSPLQFPNIRTLLQIALTLPVTSCECERSFSQLKLLKTYSRSTISAKRFSGLALMKIHRDYCVELLSPERIKELVQKFSEKNDSTIFTYRLVYRIVPSFSLLNQCGNRHQPN